MKLSIKFAAILCLQFLAMTTFAQSGKKAFTGIWELSQGKYNDQPLQNAPPGLLKIFNADGTFSNVRVQRPQSIISHSGTYKVTDGKHYLETAINRIPEMNGLTPLGEPLEISYEFSEDKKLLTLNFTAATGIIVTEIWRKL
jgi:hypothetical protein